MFLEFTFLNSKRAHYMKKKINLVPTPSGCVLLIFLYIIKIKEEGLLPVRNSEIRKVLTLENFV